LEIPGGNRITIIYCAECAYGRRAVRMAEHILDEFFEFLPSGVHLVPGSREIFDVYLNDKLLFSKHATGRHANDREVEDQLIDILEG
jgi:selT/selW/selH-like putative selenoprotein